MDIKTLLLKGLSSERPISGYRRLHFGKSCYAIRFELRGKYLKITRIRKTLTKPLSLGQRIKRRCRLVRLYQNRVQHYISNKPNSESQQADYIGDHGRYLSLQLSELQTLAIQSTIDFHTKAVQTTFSAGAKQLKLISSSTQTEGISLSTSAQQTIASLKLNLNRAAPRKLSSPPPIPPPPLVFLISKANQTEVNAISIGVQCKRHSSAVGSQTDELVAKSICTQTWNDQVGHSTSDTKNLGNSNENPLEREAVIYMLNEIGELVLNQNHMLSNNSKILDQISEVTMLTKMVSLGQVWRDRTRKRTMRRHKSFIINNMQEMESGSCKRQHVTYLEGVTKSTQTEEPQLTMLDECTQTTFEWIKSRKFLCIKKSK